MVGNAILADFEHPEKGVPDLRSMYQKSKFKD